MELEAEPFAEPDESAQERSSDEHKDDCVTDTSEQVPPETREDVVVPVAADGFNGAKTGFVGDVGAGTEEGP